MTNLYSITTLNPETGSGDDLVATSRAAVKHLTTLCTERGDWHYGRFGINSVLKEAGFVPMTAHLVLFLNFIGVVCKTEKEGGEGGSLMYRYGVIDPTYFDVFATPERVKVVLKLMAERQALQKGVNTLGKKLEAKKGKSKMSDADVAEINEGLAEVVAEVERLRGEIVSKDARIADLEQQLKATPKADAKDIARELVARALKVQKGKVS